MNYPTPIPYVIKEIGLRSFNVTCFIKKFLSLHSDWSLSIPANRKWPFSLFDQILCWNLKRFLALWSIDEFGRVKSFLKMKWSSVVCASYSAVRNAGIVGSIEQCLAQQVDQVGEASAAHPYVARGYKGAP